MLATLTVATKSPYFSATQTSQTKHGDLTPSPLDPSDLGTCNRFKHFSPHLRDHVGVFHLEHRWSNGRSENDDEWLAWCQQGEWLDAPKNGMKNNASPNTWNMKERFPKTSKYFICNALREKPRVWLKKILMNFLVTEAPWLFASVSSSFSTWLFTIGRFATSPGVLTFDFLSSEMLLDVDGSFQGQTML